MRNKYLDYRRLNKDKDVKLDRGEFRASLALFNKKVMDAIIFDSFDFKIKGLGILSLKKVKVDRFKDGKLNKRLPIDWQKSREFKKIIYLLNEHTDGYKYFFDFKPYNFKNRRYFRFDSARDNDRYLAKILKNPDIYGNVDAYIK